MDIRESLSWLEGLTSYLQEANPPPHRRAARKKAGLKPLPQGKLGHLPGATDRKVPRRGTGTSTRTGTTSMKKPDETAAALAYAKKARIGGSETGAALDIAKKARLGKLDDSRGFFGNLVGDCRAVLEGGGAWNPADDDNTDKARAREREDRARAVKTEGDTGDDKRSKIARMVHIRNAVKKMKAQKAG